MSEGQRQEPSDWHNYRIFLSRKFLAFLVDSLNYYGGLLQAENAAVLEDKHLVALLGADNEDDFEINEEIRRAGEVSEFLKSKLQKEGSQYRIFLHMDHGLVRYLKSVGLLYLGFLRQRRNEYSKRPNLSRRLLACLDREITSKEEVLTAERVFASATEIPLLVDQSLASSDTNMVDQLESESVIQVRRPSPVIVESIELLDEQLRSRCVDLYEKFRATGESERFDTVVTEATRILENRLRDITGLSETGLSLASASFGKRGLLRVSYQEAEQEGVNALFRGVFGFVRNRVHHSLHPDMGPQRVMQILGLIDYLLFLIASAERQEQE